MYYVIAIHTESETVVGGVPIGDDIDHGTDVMIEWMQQDNRAQLAGTFHYKFWR